MSALAETKSFNALDSARPISLAVANEPKSDSLSEDFCQKIWLTAANLNRYCLEIVLAMQNLAKVISKLTNRFGKTSSELLTLRRLYSNYCDGILILIVNTKWLLLPLCDIASQAGYLPETGSIDAVQILKMLPAHEHLENEDYAGIIELASRTRRRDFEPWLASLCSLHRMVSAFHKDARILRNLFISAGVFCAVGEEVDFFTPNGTSRAQEWFDYARKLDERRFGKTRSW
jgi:hypothetical protein